MSLQEFISEIIEPVREILDTNEDFNQDNGETFILDKEFGETYEENLKSVHNEFCFGCHIALLFNKYEEDQKEAWEAYSYSDQEDCAINEYDWDPHMPERWRDPNEHLLYDPEIHTDVTEEEYYILGHDEMDEELNHSYSEEEIEENNLCYARATSDVDGKKFCYTDGIAWVEQKMQEVGLGYDFDLFCAVMWACGTDHEPFSMNGWDYTPKEILHRLEKIKRLPTQREADLWVEGGADRKVAYESLLHE